MPRMAPAVTLTGQRSSTGEVSPQCRQFYNEMSHRSDASNQCIAAFAAVRHRLVAVLHAESAGNTRGWHPLLLRCARSSDG